MTLPLPLRNRLAELILEALSDPRARQALETVAAACLQPDAEAIARPLSEAFPFDLFEERGGGLRLKGGFKAYEAEFGERAERARRILHGRPLDAPDPPLATALVSAALLFHAHLYFEVHELLEPYWMRSESDAREALQGLIQIAVGFQHLANGNVSGACALLHDGCAKVLERQLEGVPLDPFGRALQHCLALIGSLGDAAPTAFDWSEVPRFPVRVGDD